MTTVPLPRARSLQAVPATAREARPRLLDRPLASYYLVLGSSGLLVVLGLVMVLSASDVSSFQQSGNPYALFEKQLMWLVVGLPLAVTAARMPLTWVRRCGYPLLLVAVMGLFAVLVPGVGVSAYGATRWIGVGGLTVQPSEIAKLALVVWGADLLVRKWRLLGEWRHLLVPLLPVGLITGALVMAEPDMGTTIVLLLIVFTLLWIAGAPARLFGMCAGGIALVGTFLAVAEPYRLARLTSFLHPFQDSQVGGYQAVQGIYALVRGRLVGQGSRLVRGEVGLPAERPHRLHLRDRRRGAGTARHAADHRAVRGARLRGHAHRAAHHRPVRQARLRCDHGLAGGPGGGQHGCRRRHPADHRHPAAVHLLRRFRAAADADRRRPARVLRAYGEWRAAVPQPSRSRAILTSVTTELPTVLLAAGGTAGHVEPALATADALRRGGFPRRSSSAPGAVSRPASCPPAGTSW